MKRIPLTKGQFALVDDEDFDELSKYKWQAKWNPDTRSFYAQRTVQRPDGRRINQFMHRFVLERQGVALDRLRVDHRNHDTLDNRRGNLRPATTSQNQANARNRRDNTSGFKGVHWNKTCQKWQVAIRVNRLRIHLGRFTTPEDAARAYNNAAREHFGEFAKLNEGV